MEPGGISGAALADAHGLRPTGGYRMRVNASPGKNRRLRARICALRVTVARGPRLVANQNPQKYPCPSRRRRPSWW